MRNSILNYYWEWDYLFLNKFSITYYYNIFLLKYTFLIILFIFLINFLIYFFTKNIFEGKIFSFFLVKYLSLLSYIFSTIFIIIYIYNFLYIVSQINLNYYEDKYIILPYFCLLNINISLDLFGIILLLLALIVGLLSFFALDNKLFWTRSKFIFYLNLFILIVFFYVGTNNILILFLFYEFLLLPSFLLVFFLSPSRKSIQASLYFVIWTQIGSFLVLTVVFYIISITGVTSLFLIKNYNFNSLEIYFLSLILFLGFGFKIPIWPFHYWLTKTHVEAPSGFSMYLSGFLVKTALYGFYKISSIFGSETNSILFSTICLIGIIDSSLKMWGQTDLKKLVAYGTIQEMNIIYLTFCWGDSLNITSGILFSITHSLLSVLMFYIVDTIYRRFSSRSVIEISGIFQLTPNLAISIILMCIFFSGLPGTLKFTTEFYIFSSFFDFSPVSCFVTFFIANCLGLIGFSKCWFNSIFGLNFRVSNINDLTIKEIYIILISFIFLVITSLFSNIFI